MKRLTVIYLTALAVLASPAAAQPALHAMRVPAFPSKCSGVAFADSFHNLWMSCGEAKVSVYRVTPRGKVGRVALPSDPARTDNGHGAVSFVQTPDGAVWLYRRAQLVRITQRMATRAFYPERDHRYWISGLTVGPDNKVWFTTAQGQDLPGRASVGNVDAAGNITTYPTLASAQEIAVGPDGALWFGEPGRGGIGRVTVGGQLREIVPKFGLAVPRLIWGERLVFATPSGNLGALDSAGTAFPLAKVRGTFGRRLTVFAGGLWSVGNLVTRVDPSGKVATYALPQELRVIRRPRYRYELSDLTVGPLSRLWTATSKALVAINPAGRATGYHFGPVLGGKYNGDYYGLVAADTTALWVVKPTDFVGHGLLYHVVFR